MNENIPGARDALLDHLEAPIGAENVRKGAVNVGQLADLSESATASQRPTSNASKQSKQSDKGDN